MIFSSKLKIDQRHRNEGSDDEENDEDYEEDAVYSVDPVTPYTGKYIVKLDVDSTKWKKTSHHHLWSSCAIPWQWRDLSRIFSRPTRCLKFHLAVFASNTSQNKQRRSHKCPDEENNEDGAKWQCCCSTVYNGDSVEKAECQEERPTKQKSCQKQIPYLQNNKGVKREGEK